MLFVVDYIKCQLIIGIKHSTLNIQHSIFKEKNKKCHKNTKLVRKEIRKSTKQKIFFGGELLISTFLLVYCMLLIECFSK